MNRFGKILIFRQSSLGDVILTLPVVEELRKRFPDSDIDYVTKAPYRPIVENCGYLRNILTFENNSQFKELLRNLRIEKYDLFIDLQANFRSLSISMVCLGSKRVKYMKRRLAREMIVRKPASKLSVDHTVNAYFRVFRKIGITAEPGIPILVLPSEERLFAEEFIDNAFEARLSNIIALCPGAKHYEKRWPVENYRKVAELLLENMDTGILVISSPEDGVPGDLGLKNPRLVPITDFPITRVAALLENCGVALTNDSGIMHLANAVGTRVAAIFGPTSPRLGFAPTLPGSRIISSDVFCSPCSVHGQKPCSQSRKYCFENIRPIKVAGILREFTEGI